MKPHIVVTTKIVLNVRHFHKEHAFENKDHIHVHGC